MAALAARDFAQRGWLVLQLDLAGCGDSSGDFGDASWQDWIEDISLACGWLQQNDIDDPVLWTLRAGSLLAADWLHLQRRTQPLLLWQPVTNGHLALTQFLRLKAAAQLLGESDSRSVIASLRSDIDAGRTVEIAGYPLSPGVARGLGSAQLRLTDDYAAPVCLLEVSRTERTQPTPALHDLLKKWKAAGIRASHDVVRGPAFWQTLAIETAPALIPASVGFLDGLRQ